MPIDLDMGSHGREISAYTDIALILFLILFMSIVHCTDDGDKSHYRYKTGRFKDCAKAITFLKENLPHNITNEELCKKYAVAAHNSLSERLPFNNTVLRVANMNLAELNEHYDQLGIERITYAYMSVIDRYRVTELAPPMIDLVECLKRIDSSVVRTYLSNEELTVILDLYKQVLGLPGTKIDIRSLDLTKFHQPFWDILRSQFRKYMDIDVIFSDSLLKSIDSSNISGPHQNEKVKAEIRQSRRRRFQSRRREHSRLTQQRLRLLNPEAVRRYQGERRKFRKDREQFLLSQSVDSSAKFEAMRMVQERRERKNERQRMRQKRLREQREHQRRLLLESTPAKVEQSNDPREILKRQIREGQHYRNPKQHLQQQRPYVPVSRLQLLPLLRVPKEGVDLEQQPRPVQPPVDSRPLPPRFLQPIEPQKDLSQCLDETLSRSEAQNPVLSQSLMACTDLHHRCQTFDSLIDNDISRNRVDNLMLARPSYDQRHQQGIDSQGALTESDETEFVMQFLLDEPQIDPNTTAQGLAGSNSDTPKRVA